MFSRCTGATNEPLQYSTKSSAAVNTVVLKVCPSGDNWRMFQAVASSMAVNIFSSSSAVGIVPPNNTRDLVFTLSQNDLNAIKSNSILALSQATTFLAVAMGAFADVSDNLISTIPTTAPQQASGYIIDSTPPMLESFDFSMDNQSLPLYIILHFDEVVSTSTLNLSKLNLTDSVDSPTVSLLLTGSVISTTGVAAAISTCLLPLLI